MKAKSSVATFMVNSFTIEILVVLIKNFMFRIVSFHLSDNPLWQNLTNI